jgi:pantetheine-phosphate adenylyltransferase
MLAPQIAVYTGSFDPPTNGHLDILARASQLFSEVIIGLGRHPTRNPLFSIEERLELLQLVCTDLQNVRVETFDTLATEFARLMNARILVRGIRNGTDFEYELQMAQANSDLAPELDTVFLPTRAMTGYLSSSRVREIASFGGDVSGYAPPIVCEALVRKFRT